MPRNLVGSVLADQDELLASVVVDNKYAFRKAIGANGWNVRLAQVLTGLSISIDDAEQRRRHEDTEGEAELPEVLKNCIPEVATSEIKVVAAARTPVVAAMVAIRWSYDKARKEPAWTVCKESLAKIREQLAGEWVGFVDWSDNDEELIHRCVFSTIKRDQISAVNLDRTSQIASLIVADEVARGVRRNSINLRLAERLTGWRIRIVSDAN